MELDSSEPKGKILDRRFLLMLCDVVRVRHNVASGKRKTEIGNWKGRGTRATRDARVVATHRTLSLMLIPHHPYQDMRCDTSRYLCLHRLWVDTDK
eukprot:scaffold48599_cov39-Cyclotella_meneghiniana.AAC.1